jgi:FkbM family methyltransferase
MYSQRNQEQYILEYFGEHKGRFLDIGAYDGVTFSNTRQLFLNGWDGVCVEPAYEPFHALLAVYGSDPGVILVNKALGEHEGDIDFWEGVGGVDHAGAVSTAMISHRKVWEGTAHFHHKIVEQITYDMLLSEHGCDYDFINIDAEGYSLRLLELLPFDRCVKLKCVCVEHDNKFTEILQHGLIHGFDRYAITDENVIMMKGNHV